MMERLTTKIRQYPFQKTLSPLLSQMMKVTTPGHRFLRSVILVGRHL